MADSLLAAVRHSHTEAACTTLLSAAHVAAEVDKLGSSGVNALGVAVWRNHAGLVEALLEAGADPDAQDSESGWTALHRALHWGQLRIAAALLGANASLTVPDWRGRSPLDLLSAELKEYVEPGGDGDVFSWGNGSNYTLGTGSTDLQLHPARIDSLHDQQVVAVSAAKFHSAAVTIEGQLLTWGWGRGGRLGHPEANIHSGDGAVIAPHVVSALGKRAVAAVAAGKHHTVLCTMAGEVFTMGSNRHGQLGYAVDSQPTPRRVTSLRQRVVAVAAANKHSVAVTSSGDVFTWGSNVLGQLGYGTSDSSSNAAPRLVEAMRGKPVVAAAAAKRHTLVLTASGEVYTWGHRGVSPRRVQLAGARDITSASGAPISFHRGHADVARPQAAAIAAGAAHSSALTATGVVLSWRSADPALQVQEVGGALAGRCVVSISAGKYRTAAVSDEGDVYMWEGRSDYFPAEGRQPGSGSKKPGSASKPPRLTLGGGSGGLRIAVGGGGGASGEGPLGSSYGAEWGGGGGNGSHGSSSYSRRPGSFIERFAREREAGGSVGPGSFGAAGSSGRPDMLGSAGKGARGSQDVFARITPLRVEGLKRTAAVAVGEKHSLAVQRWSAAQLEGMVAVPWLQQPAPAAPPGAAAAATAAAEEEDRRFQRAADGLIEDGQLATPRGLHQLEAEHSAADSAASPGPSPNVSPGKPSPVRLAPRRARGGGAAAAVGPSSLQRICEEEVARRLVDPRTCLQVLEYADVAGAEVLRAYCLAVAICNLDAVLLEAGGAFEELAPHLLSEMERIYKLRLAGTGASSAPAAAAEAPGPSTSEAAGSCVARAAAPLPQLGSRLQPGRRPTAAAPRLGDEGVGEEAEGHRPQGFALPPLVRGGSSGSSFLDRQQADAAAAVERLRRMLNKKVQQIEQLEARAEEGAALDPQQRSKVHQKPVILSALAALEGGMAVDDVQRILRAAAGSQEAEEPAAAGPGSSGARAAAPSSSGKPPKSKGKKSGAQKAAPPADEPSSSSPTAMAVGAAMAASSSLLGSSPPTSSLVPAFGAAGSAAAAAEQPRTPAGQMRSLVGFASSNATDGVGAAPQQLSPQQQLEQQPVLGRPSSTVKTKSAAKRKGGLSMFLRGDLEQAAAAAEAAAAVERSSGSAPAPAWGARAAAPAGAASLKQILDQEVAAVAPSQQQGSASKPPTGQRATPGSAAKTRSIVESAGAAIGPGAAAAAGPLRLSLASFMQQSSPIAMQQRQDAASPPPVAWGGAAGASPPGRQASLRAIQQEQQALLPVKSYGSSPPAVQRLAGSGLPPWRPPVPPPAAGGGSGAAAASTSLLGTSPAGSSSLLGSSPLGRGGSSFLAAPMPQHSKWYVPEESRADIGKSLTCIQSEEVVRAELAKMSIGPDSARLATNKQEQRPQPKQQQQLREPREQQQQHPKDKQEQRPPREHGERQQRERRRSGPGLPRPGGPGASKQESGGDGGGASTPGAGGADAPATVGRQDGGNGQQEQQNQQRQRRSPIPLRPGGGRGGGREQEGGGGNGSGRQPRQQRQRRSPGLPRAGGGGSGGDAKPGDRNGSAGADGDQHQQDGVLGAEVKQGQQQRRPQGPPRSGDGGGRGSRPGRGGGRHGGRGGGGRQGANGGPAGGRPGSASREGCGPSGTPPSDQAPVAAVAAPSAAAGGQAT